MSNTYKLRILTLLRDLGFYSKDLEAYLGPKHWWSAGRADVAMLKALYAPDKDNFMKGLLYTSNPFLKLMVKDSTSGSLYNQPVVLPLSSKGEK